jgi:hypothetical protein
MQARLPGPRRGRAGIASLLASLLLAVPAIAGPPPPAPTPPVARRAPPPPVQAPVPIYAPAPVPTAPPPLPVAMRVIYAPFYVAGLVVRYTVQYVLVAPFEVLFRTIDYGASGGVDPTSAPNQVP